MDATYEYVTDNDNSLEDTLEAEISRLETTLNGLEEITDLPNIEDFVSDLEEGEIFDSFMCEEGELTNSNLQVEKKIGVDGNNILKCSDPDSTEREIRDSNDESHCLEHVKTPLKLNASVYVSFCHSGEKKSDPIDIIDLVSSPETVSCKGSPVQQKGIDFSNSRRCIETKLQDGKSQERGEVSSITKLKIPNDLNSTTSVITVKNCKEVFLKFNDHNFNTNNFVENIEKKTESSSLDSIIINSVKQRSNQELQLDFSVSEEEFLNRTNIPSTFVSASLVSSTPCRINVVSPKRWKSKACPLKDTFFILDESGESSDHENSEISTNSSPIEVSVISETKTLIQDMTTIVNDLPLQLNDDNKIGAAEDEDNHNCDQKQVAVSDDEELKIILCTNNEATEHRNSHQSSLSTEKLLITPLVRDILRPSVTGPNIIRSETEIRDNSPPKAGPNTIASDIETECKPLLPVTSEFKSKATSLPSVAGPDVIRPTSEIEANDAPLLPVTGLNIISTDIETKVSGSLSNIKSDQVSVDGGVQKTAEEFSDNSNSESNILVQNCLSAGINQNSVELKTNKDSKGDFVSNNPQENADNNDPEWELLRKLQTDEERYRAVRKRWRNLVVPDPNRDLTYHNWKIQHNVKNTTSIISSSKPATVIQKNTTGTGFINNVPAGKHKRNISEDPSVAQDRHQTKRLRTRSCTALFDKKLQELHVDIESKKQSLYNQERQALQQLDFRKSQQMNYLQKYRTSYNIRGEMQNIYCQQMEDIARIHRRFDDARIAVDRANLDRFEALKKASEEVRAFHKFYQGLEHESDKGNSSLLSESQVEELLETEHLYEQYDKYYSA